MAMVSVEEVDQAVEMEEAPAEEASMEVADEAPAFPAMTAEELAGETQYQRVPVPPHRYACAWTCMWARCLTR